MNANLMDLLDAASPQVMAPLHLASEGRTLEAALGRAEWAAHGVVFASSGSGGEPKWILLKQDALLHSARVVNRHLGVSHGDCWFLALPAFHVGGFGVLARAHAAGCRTAGLSAMWEPAHFVAELADAAATHTSLVPTQVFDLVRDGLGCPDALRAVVVGGGALDERLGQQARDLGWPVLQSYGMTESGSQVATASLDSLDERFRNAPLSVLPDWDLRVNDAGCLELRGPALFDCYVTMDGGNARRIEAARDGWFATTDLVDIEGQNLTFRGRSDRIVKVLGELVNLADLESRLQAEWSGGTECHVVAVDDQRSGHRPCPVFEKQVPDDLDEVLARINASLPGFSRLGPPRIVSDLPRTPIGKVDYKALMEMPGTGLDPS